MSTSQKLIVLVIAFLLLRGGGSFAPTKVEAVTYVYEKDAGSIPPPVAAVLSKLNAQDIIATTFDVDTTDGAGEVPDQYKVAVVEAKRIGLPALVATGGGKVIRIVKDPQTEVAAMEVAK